MSEIKIIRRCVNAAAASLEIEVDGERLYIALYSAAVVENGWEPHDQPAPSAYVPLSRERLHVIALAGGQQLLVSRKSH